LVASPAAATISAGQSASFALAFNPGSAAVGQNLSFSCANLPLGANCSFSPGTLTAQSGPATVNLTIATTASVAWLAWPTRETIVVGFWLPLALVLVPGWSAGKTKRAWVLAMLLFLASVLFACSGAKSTNTVNSPPPAAPVAGTITPAGAYNIVIHVQGGTLESSTAVQLTVK
jgi:hypothetical protein